MNSSDHRPPVIDLLPRRVVRRARIPIPEPAELPPLDDLPYTQARKKLVEDLKLDLSRFKHAAHQKG